MSDMRQVVHWTKCCYFAVSAAIMLMEVAYDIAYCAFKVALVSIGSIDHIMRVVLIHYTIVSLYALMYLFAAKRWIEFLSPAMFFGLVVFVYTCASLSLFLSWMPLLQMGLIAIPAIFLNVFLIVRECRLATPERS